MKRFKVFVLTSNT